MDAIETAKLCIKTAMFDTNAAMKLSKVIPPQQLWTLKLSMTAFYIGGIVNGYRASITRSHQFLAENSHRMPTTKGGWFEYHKHKHYALIRQFIRSGLRSGLRFGLYVLVYCELEQAVILVNGEHCVNGAVAGLASDKLWWSSSKLVLLTSTMGGLTMSSLQSLSLRLTGKSIKEFGANKDGLIEGFGGDKTEEIPSYFQSITAKFKTFASSFFQ